MFVVFCTSHKGPVLLTDLKYTRSFVIFFFKNLENFCLILSHWEYQLTPTIKRSYLKGGSYVFWFRESYFSINFWWPSNQCFLILSLSNRAVFVLYETCLITLDRNYRWPSLQCQLSKVNPQWQIERLKRYQYWFWKQCDAQRVFSSLAKILQSIQWSICTH